MINFIISELLNYNFIRREGFNYLGSKAKIFYPFIITEKKLISIGSNTKILKNSRIQNFVFDNCKAKEIRIGDNCYIGYNFTILNASSVIIGDVCLIASNVMITSENHGMNPESEKSYSFQGLTSKPVIINSDAWIGQNVSILSGVTIGKKSIIGTNSVVTKNIPDYCIAVGGRVC